MRRMPLAGRCRCAGGRPPSAGPAATVDAAIGFEYCMRILNEQQVGVPIRRETESDLYVLAPTNPARDRRDGKYDTRSNPNITLPPRLPETTSGRARYPESSHTHHALGGYTPLRLGRAARRTGARRAVARVESASDSERVRGSRDWYKSVLGNRCHARTRAATRLAYDAVPIRMSGESRNLLRFVLVPAPRRVLGDKR